MTMAPDQSLPRTASPARLALVFLILFLAYQLPEGLGQRGLHSTPVAATLLLMFLPVAWLCGRMLGYRGLDAWYLRAPRWRVLLGGFFVLAVAAKLGALVIGTKLGVYKYSGLSAEAPGIALTALWMLPYTFFPSIAEDIVTRGFVMRAFPALSRRWLFIPFSALVFVLNHIYRLSNGPAEWTMLFCFGLAYAAALYYSRSLWAAVGLHWGWNYLGQLSDNVASIDALTANSWVLSALVHLLLLAGVTVFYNRLASSARSRSFTAG
ncbi:hypothetical protein GCM10027321_41670 [Massilia terrae]